MTSQAGQVPGSFMAASGVKGLKVKYQYMSLIQSSVSFLFYHYLTPNSTVLKQLAKNGKASF